MSVTSGTRKDGTWTGTMDLPQGLAPGSYDVKAITWDKDQNTAAYASPGAPDWFGDTLQSDATLTVIDSTAGGTPAS